MSPSSYIILPFFLFALGACIGSFLNVVVWRLPRGESLVTPPSHCPKCDKHLKFYDNIPVFGWLMLRGRCRFCKEGISPRYPIVEAITGLLFLGYYLLFFVAQMGPSLGVRIDGDHGVVLHRTLNIISDWPIYLLDMFLVSALLAASLIDAELFIIPIEIPWLVTLVALIAHAIHDTPDTPGGLNAGPIPAALAAGAGVGTILSYVLWTIGIIPTSFAEGGPLMEHERAEHEKQKKEHEANPPEEYKRGKHAPPAEDTEPEPREWTSGEIRREMAKEMLFLLPPLLLGSLVVLLVWRVPAAGRYWSALVSHAWFSALLGSILGGLIGGFVVWLTRILGTLAFGREAMGLGDVHLMVAVGAVLGAGSSVVAFFLAPFFGVILAIYMLLTGKRRELPYGPYLSLGSAFAILFYSDVLAYMAPGGTVALQMLRNFLAGG